MPPIPYDRRACVPTPPHPKPALPASDARSSSVTEWLCRLRLAGMSGPANDDTVRMAHVNNASREGALT